jgi:hypothetical protein
MEIVLQRAGQIGEYLAVADTKILSKRLYSLISWHYDLLSGLERKKGKARQRTFPFRGFQTFGKSVIEFSVCTEKQVFEWWERGGEV